MTIKFKTTIQWADAFYHITSHLSSAETIASSLPSNTGTLNWQHIQKLPIIATKQHKHPWVTEKTFPFSSWKQREKPPPLNKGTTCALSLIVTEWVCVWLKVLLRKFRERRGGKLVFNLHILMITSLSHSGLRVLRCGHDFLMQAVIKCLKQIRLLFSPQKKDKGMTIN